MVQRLLQYCAAENWSGYDPYDALNSRVYRALPFLHYRAPRLVLTQAVKRCPLNLRPLLGVPKEQNAKGIALFIAATVRLRRHGVLQDSTPIPSLVDRLMAMRSSDRAHACWGYNFDWQSRVAFIPRGLPNIICTSFAGNALLDAHEILHEPEWLEHAESAAAFLIEELYSESPVACFGYFPKIPSRVHNANFLGAAFVARVATLRRREDWLKKAVAAARYSCSRQQADGAWAYGEESFQDWCDNFHTGFNLCALQMLAACSPLAEFRSAYARGMTYYLKHFFDADGAPRYYDSSRFPIDIHSAAQSIITLCGAQNGRLEAQALAFKVLNWTRQHMRNERNGSFFFQKHRWFTNRTSFMRWSQAWMLLALATFLESESRADTVLCS